MRRAALLVFAGALAAIAVSASRRPLPHRIFVPTGAGTTYRPRTLYISPDGADNWTVTAWRHYGGWTAEAVVTTGVNDCTPDCVDGHCCPRLTPESDPFTAYDGTTGMCCGDTSC